MAYFDISADRKTMLITHDQAEPVPVTEQYTAAEVEALLSTVGRARSALLPPIPETWDAAATVTAERDPRCFIGHDQLAGDALLHLRDHHFGWRHYIFTKAEARKLGLALIAQADAVPPQSAGRA